MVALRDQDDPAAAFCWALEMARALSARLHVLQVLPAGRYQVARRSSRIFAHLLSRSSVHRPVIESAAVLHGDFVQQSTQYAAATKATVIVLANGGKGPGELARRLASSAQRPVLVARTPVGAPKRVVDARALALAASDLFGDAAEERSPVGSDRGSVPASGAVQANTFHLP